jgi:hypothetical protein
MSKRRSAAHFSISSHLLTVAALTANPIDIYFTANSKIVALAGATVNDF